MSWSELQTKYGRGKARAVLNRAVRAETPGADDMFEAAQKIRCELDNPGPHRTPEDKHTLRKTLVSLDGILDSLRADVCRRYRIPGQAGEPGPEVAPSPAPIALDALKPPPPAEPLTHAERRAWTPPAAIVERMGHASDADVAREAGVSATQIATCRDRLGIAAYEAAGDAHRWTPAMDRLLGTAPDGDLAKKWERSAEAVRRRREKLGIPAMRRKSAWTAERLQVLRDQPDNDRAAAALGISVAAVKTARSRLKPRG